MPWSPRWSLWRLGVSAGHVTSSVLAPSSVALVTTSKALVPSSFLLLLVRPGAPGSVLAPSSTARSP